jgi:hypothetical protein
MKSVRRLGARRGLHRLGGRFGAARSVACELWDGGQALIADRAQERKNLVVGIGLISETVARQLIATLPESPPRNANRRREFGLTR